MAAVLRLAGLLGFLFAAIPFLSWLFEGLRDGDFFDLGYYFDRMMLTFALGVGGAILLVLSGVIARILVPFPKPRCPRCTYRIQHLHAPRCPECGIELPEEMMTGPPPASPPTPPA